MKSESFYFMLKRQTLYFLLSIFSINCATIPAIIQPQINGLVVAGKFNAAIEAMEQNQETYGPQNQLLYDMDYGLVLHLAGQYDKSIEAFERAKRAYDKILTISLSREAATWLVNDYMAPYRPEDFERVMINVFQSLNFVSLGNIEEALVEARDVDSKLKLIDSQYKAGQKNVYQEDAFVRFLMGILYEAQGTYEGYNDAFISYQKAVDIYDNDFVKNYNLTAPLILKENILAAAEFMGPEEFETYQQKFGDIKFLSLKEKSQKTEVYLIHYAGFSPIKHPFDLPIPLPGGYMSKLAFPKYEKRILETKQRMFRSVSLHNQEASHLLEKAQDIGAIAIKNLENRRARVIAKAVLRLGGKYFLEQEGEKYLNQHNGETSSRWFRYLSNIYNITSEQADLRSWQTLPDTIEISRLILEPGEYQFFIDHKQIQQLKLQKGDKKFIIYRSVE